MSKHPPAASDISKSDWDRYIHRCSLELTEMRGSSFTDTHAAEPPHYVEATPWGAVVWSARALPVMAVVSNPAADSGGRAARRAAREYAQPATLLPAGGRTTVPVSLRGTVAAGWAGFASFLAVGQLGTEVGFTIAALGMPASYLTASRFHRITNRRHRRWRATTQLSPREVTGLVARMHVLGAPSASAHADVYEHLVEADSSILFANLEAAVDESGARAALTRLESDREAIYGLVDLVVDSLVEPEDAGDGTAGAVFVSADRDLRASALRRAESRLRERGDFDQVGQVSAFHVGRSALVWQWDGALPAGSTDLIRNARKRGHVYLTDAVPGEQHEVFDFDPIVVELDRREALAVEEYAAAPRPVPVVEWSPEATTVRRLADVRARHDALRDDWLDHQQDPSVQMERPELADVNDLMTAEAIVALAKASDLASTVRHDDAPSVEEYAAAVEHAERMWEHAKKDER